MLTFGGGNATEATMELEFKDSCTITRESGKYDDWDNPIGEVIYEGECMFQQGGQTSHSIITRNDKVYLPSNDVIIEANDVIDVVTARGRKRHGVVNLARDIEMQITKELLTEIEIKQGTGK